MDCECGSDGPEANGSSRRNAGIQLDEQNKYFENIVPQGSTAMEAVERHNKAYPCLEEELEKKRSAADATNRQLPNAKNRQQHRYNAACKACMRLKALTDIEKYDIKPRCEKRETETKGEKEKEHIRKKLTPTRKRKYTRPVVIRSLTNNTNEENDKVDKRQNRREKKKGAEKRKTPVGSLCNICRKKLKKDGAHRCRELNKGIRKAASGVSANTHSKTPSEGSMSRYSGESSIGPELGNEPMD